MTHSVESRFLAILSGALLIFVAPLFVLFLFLSSGRAKTDLANHVSIVITSNAKALAQPLWDLDSESMGSIADTIVTDPAIVRVVVRDTSNAFEISRAEPSYKPDMPLASRSEWINHKSARGLRQIGQLTVYYREVGLFSSLKPVEIGFITIFAFAVLAVSVAAIIGNRMMIITPLLRLTAAVDATRRSGSRERVEWDSRDEMGNLAARFNEMQSKLEREERELRNAHRRATDIYNHTPAMLYSIDREDRISAVSDYWLVATGYRRSDVLGRLFSSMVVPDDRDKYARRSETSGADGEIVDRTVRFIKADGSMMHVLIVETLPGVGGIGDAYSLSVMTDVTALKESEEHVRRQAVTDHLTGLMNRKGFETALQKQIERADETSRQLACLFIDLDRFKWINDNLGHAAGDAVLCDVVHRLKPILAEGDTISRLGGDEFAILRMSADAQTEAYELARQLTELFNSPFDAAGIAARLSASIGIALYPQHARSGAELLQKSDLAMYARKREGKNGASVYDTSMTDRTRRRAELEDIIEIGLDQDWVETYFQPLICLRSNRIEGYEALMRIVHPVQGILPPADIISVAEETGSIIAMGNRVLEKALSHFAALQRKLPEAGHYVAINFSSMQIEPGLPARLATLLERYGLPPSALVVEITEAVLMQDNPDISMILSQIRHYGCRIALDDFGTGYSSLSYLNRFPVDIVKVDQSFIRALSGGQGDAYDKSRMLVEGITAISHKMACTVVAEGIETRDQWQTLIDMGVDYGQGYLFSRPLPVPDLERLIASDGVQVKMVETARG